MMGFLLPKGDLTAAVCAFQGCNDKNAPFWTSAIKKRKKILRKISLRIFLRLVQNRPYLSLHP
jgi:hypothetical protein